MVNTVTASTFSTLTAAGSGSPSAVGICLLLALIVCKELVTPERRQKRPRLDEGLSIIIAPLLCMFALIVAIRVYALFR